MCGIIGFNWEDRNLVNRMIHSIQHRGPDQNGSFVDGGVTLGHVRLSIVDLSERGKQPLTSHDGTVTIVFNGEIYNYLALRPLLEKKYHFSSNTDTEVLLYGYKEWGVEGLLKRIDGMFAFCIYDSEKKIFFLARDRLGKKPLYYYNNSGKFIFASEIKAILEDASVPRKVNAEVLNQFLMRRFSPWEETMFNGINKIMPAQYALFDLAEKKLKIRSYWDIRLDLPKIHDRRMLEKKIKRLFDDAIQKRFMSDVPFGAFLSGGFDSTAVVGAMSRFLEEPIKTFSVGFVGDDISNELPYAKAVSEHFSTEHKEIELGSDVLEYIPKIVWHLDEPLADPAAVPNYFLAKEAKKKVTVILTGDGGDELFGGYDQYKFLLWGHRLRHVPRIVRKKAIPFGISITPKLLLDKFYKYSSSTGEEMITRFKKFIAESDNKAKAYLEIMSIFDEEERKRLLSKATVSKIKDFDNYSRINNRFFNGKSDLLSQVCYFDVKQYLPEDLLMKPDKMCMAHAIEARVPLLDTKLVELAFRIPSSMKISGMNTKVIMKQALRPYLPEVVLKRKKQTFNVPIDVWFDREFKSSAEGILEQNSKINKGFFNKREIDRIISRFDKSKLFYARQLWSLVNFNIWHEKYIGANNL